MGCICLLVTFALPVFSDCLVSQACPRVWPGSCHFSSLFSFWFWLDNLNWFVFRFADASASSHLSSPSSEFFICYVLFTGNFHVFFHNFSLLIVSIWWDIVLILSFKFFSFSLDLWIVDVKSLSSMLGVWVSSSYFLLNAYPSLCMGHTCPVSLHVLYSFCRCF